MSHEILASAYKDAIAKLEAERLHLLHQQRRIDFLKSHSRLESVQIIRCGAKATSAPAIENLESASARRIIPGQTRP